MPHFIEIVNQAFPEFQRLSKYLEVNALSHLLGRDETAFRRVADASLSVNDGFPAMMARVITAFPAADVDTVMSKSTSSVQYAHNKLTCIGGTA